MEINFGKRSKAYKDGIKFIIDPEDFEKIKDKSFFLHTGGYVASSKKQYLHRILMNPPDDKMVDHINGNKLDNRKSNLRVCSNQENQMNTRKQKNNKSGFKGVYFDKQRNKFKAQIMIDGKNKNLGLFENPEDAYKKYCEFAKKFHGDFFNSGETN